MPHAAPSSCSQPLCPHPAVDRGRCVLHQLSEAARGYGRAHRVDRAVNRPGARCEGCGSTDNLERDHRIPPSLGGTEHPTNKRWLCRDCHHRMGLRRDRTHG